MGSFPHELPGYQHISGAAAREVFSRSELGGQAGCRAPGLRIPNMFDAGDRRGRFKGLYLQGEDILPVRSLDTRHVSAAMANMEIVIVQDLFPGGVGAFYALRLPAGLFLLWRRTAPSPTPSAASSAIRKVIQRRRTAMATGRIHPASPPRSFGLGWNLPQPSDPEIMDEIARPDAIVPQRLLREARLNWAPCSGRATTTRRKACRSCTSIALRTARANSVIDRICRDRREGGTALPAAADDGPHPVPVRHGGRAAPPPNRPSGPEDVLEIHPL